MKWIVIVAAVVLGSILLDRLALWMEKRGWIYYRRNKPSSSRLGTAFLEIQSILEPDKKQIIEVKKEDKKQSQELGDEPGDPDSE